MLKRFKGILRKAPRKLQKPKKIFGFTQGSDIYVTRYRGKPAILRVDRESPHKVGALNQFYRHKILHMLFPKNSIKPLNIGFIVENNKERFGLISEILKNRGRDYKEYQKWVYVDKYADSKRSDAVRRHDKFVKDIALPLAHDIRINTGIELNDHEVNIANVNGKPVFFEIFAMYNKRSLANYVSSLNIEAKKAKLLKALIVKL